MGEINDAAVAYGKHQVFKQFKTFQSALRLKMDEIQVRFVLPDPLGKLVGALGIFEKTVKGIHVDAPLPVEVVSVPVIVVSDLDAKFDPKCLQVALQCTPGYFKAMIPVMIINFL